MAYQISWHLEKQVLHVCFSGKVNEADLIDSSEDVYNLLAESDTLVHLLYNGIGIEDFPRSMLTIKRALRHFSMLPALGWFFFSGFSTPDLRYISNAIMQVTMRNFKNVHSLEDLDLILQQVDPTIEIPVSRTRA